MSKTALVPLTMGVHKTNASMSKECMSQLEGACTEQTGTIGTSKT